ncbi:hypothetical protein ID0079_01170 [Helicobacter pylori]
MHGVVDDILKIYESLGYRVKFKILNSAWYGSATKRERARQSTIPNPFSAPTKLPLPALGSKKWNAFKPSPRF